MNSGEEIIRRVREAGVKLGEGDSFNEDPPNIFSTMSGGRARSNDAEHIPDNLF